MNASVPVLSLDRVSRRFGNVAALDTVSLDIASGEIVCLVGHSGCGKSTLLRVIAGVEHADAGRVLLGGSLVDGDGEFVEPEDRKVGFMFQDYALFPHLSVRQNIAFGLRTLPARDREARIGEVIERIGIRSLADRYPHMLSGGEQQRVALARALAPQPHVLLMDEPFSNLDRGLRDVVRRETLALIRALDATAIIVTHDPEEALAIGDRIALMSKGRVVETGTGDKIYNRPDTAYAASFFSHVNRLVARRAGDFMLTVLGPVAVPPGTDGTIEVYVRPHALHITDDGVPARVESVAVLGEVEEATLTVEGHGEKLILRSTQRHSIRAGETVRIAIDAKQAMFFQTAQDDSV